LNVLKTNDAGASSVGDPNEQEVTNSFTNRNLQNQYDDNKIISPKNYE